MFDNEKRNLKIIEDFIQNQLYLFNLENMKHLQSHGYSGFELDYANDEIQDILYNNENIENMYQQLFFEDFSYVIRKSFFVTAYHSFESYLQYFCEDTERRLNLSAYKDFPGNGVNKIKNYIEQATGIKISSSEKWKDISAYNKLRNCIVHGEGVLYKCSNQEFLLGYISSNPYLTYIDEIEEVRLEKGFCEEALENFSVFATHIKVIH